MQHCSIQGREFLVVGVSSDVVVWTRTLERDLRRSLTLEITNDVVNLTTAVWTEHPLHPPASAIPPAERDGALVRMVHIVNSETVIATYLSHGIL